MEFGICLLLSSLAPVDGEAEAAVQAEGVTRHDLRASMPEPAWRKFPAQVPVGLPPECTRSFLIFWYASIMRRAKSFPNQYSDCVTYSQCCFAQP